MALTIYNQVVYGQPLYYGSVDAASELLWALEIDWFANGSYGDGFNEAMHMVDLSVERGRNHIMTSNGWERYRPGRIVATMDNDDGRYDPYNASSPIYGHIAPGKFVKLSVLYNGTLYAIMRGMVYDIQPFNRGRRRFVQITILDGLQFLAERLTSRAVFNATEFYHIIDLAINAGWPNDPDTWYQQIYGSAGGQTFKTFFWKHNALKAISDLADAFNAEVFHAADGDLAVVGPIYTYNSITAIDESEVLADIEINQPWENIRNEIEIVERYYVDTASASNTLWSLQNPIAITAGQLVEIDALFEYERYRPVGGRSLGSLSFAVNTASDGSGTDLTANCIGTRELNAGEGTLITIRNNSGQNGYIISASLTGAAVYNPNDSIYSARDLVSQTQFGKKSFKLDSPWVEGGSYAQSYADKVLRRFKNPTLLPKIKIEKRPDIQVGKELYVDLIHLKSGTLGINKAFRIGAIEYQIVNPTGQHLRTTFSLEPYFGELYELWSPFEENGEINGVGPVDYNKMIWSRSGWYQGSGYSGLGMETLFAEATGGNHMTTASTLLISSGAKIVYRYRWTGDEIVGGYGTVAARLDISTVESGSGAVVQDYIPYVAPDSGWLQHEVSLENFVGQTIDEIKFVRLIQQLPSTTKLSIDDVRVGIRIDFGG